MEQLPRLIATDPINTDVPHPKPELRLVVNQEIVEENKTSTIDEPLYPQIRREEIISSTRSFHQEARSRLQRKRAATQFLIAVFRQMREDSPF